MHGGPSWWVSASKKLLAIYIDTLGVVLWGKLVRQWAQWWLYGHTQKKS